MSGWRCAFSDAGLVGGVLGEPTIAVVRACSEYITGAVEMTQRSRLHSSLCLE